MSISTPLKIGIIGCGNIHKIHAEAINRIPRAAISAFFDEIPEKAVAAASQYGGVAVNSLDELIDRSDAVDILLPSSLHSPIAIKSAQAGKHVVTEKPLDVRFAPALAMVEACEAANVKLACISQHRFASDIQRLKAALDDGTLGTPVQGDAYIKWFRSQGYYESAGWRGTWEFDGGGCLMNQGVHYIDMLQWVMGGVKSVRAITRTMAHDIEVEDTANALVEYNNGAIGVIQGTTLAYPGLPERLEVHGTKGTVLIEGDRAKIWEVMPETPEPFGRHVAKKTGEELGEDGTAKWDEQHYLQLKDFVEAILANREPFITGRAALEPLKIILAIYKSSQMGGEKVELREVGA
jgi:UDP-N-acetyl-2-amino-2-deoxyglucuronate dehydrogenase